MEFDLLWDLYRFHSPDILDWHTFLTTFKRVGDHWTKGAPQLWISPTNRNKSICNRLNTNNARALYSTHYPHLFILTLVPQFNSYEDFIRAVQQFEIIRRENNLFTPREKVSARIIQRAYRNMIARYCRPEGKWYYKAKNEFDNLKLKIRRVGLEIK